MRPVLSIVLVLMIVFAGDAQGDRKTHLPLAIKTIDVIAPNALIHLYLKAPQPDLKPFIKALSSDRNLESLSNLICLCSAKSLIFFSS